jgi:DMSO/TMAO reductase YedYZ molybdopterin-dependent catalytic subunit
MRDMMSGTRVKVYGAEYMTQKLEIRGRVERPTSFSVRELRAMPVARAEGFSLICGSGKVKDVPRELEGVLVSYVLNLVGVSLPDHEAPNRSLVVATGSDGYRSIFSWHEIFNAKAPARVMIAYSKDGAPLDEREGELCLVSPDDERPGPRRVRYLATIEVVEFGAG